MQCSGAGGSNISTSQVLRGVARRDKASHWCFPRSPNQDLSITENRHTERKKRRRQQRNYEELKKETEYTELKLSLDEGDKEGRRKTLRTSNFFYEKYEGVCAHKLAKNFRQATTASREIGEVGKPSFCEHPLSIIAKAVRMNRTMSPAKFLEVELEHVLATNCGWLGPKAFGTKGSKMECCARGASLWRGRSVGMSAEDHVVQFVSARDTKKQSELS